MTNEARVSEEVNTDRVRDDIDDGHPVGELAVVQLLHDYDRLRDLYFKAIRAGDDMADACADLAAVAYAHRLPAYPVVEQATQTIKSWRSAR